jgi:cellulose 1,4-beta-cellobiosidase
MDAICLFLAYFIAIGSAQQPGVQIPEFHPKLATETCTTSKGCSPVNTSIVLDAGFRWLHKIGSNANCISGKFDPSICPDPETCVKNCALEGVDYSKFGLKTAGSAVTMNLFRNENNKLTKVSPRIYLYDESKERYAIFKLMNQEFTFDVDMSKAGCGVNGALYFSEMSPTGHQDSINRAGAKYGVGYCDAQCPKDNFINGRVSC